MYVRSLLTQCDIRDH